MADIKELWTEADWKDFEMYENCKSSRERKQLIREQTNLTESKANIVYPHIEMSVEEFCAKYNLIERDEFKW
jgi:hypothetical protein